jgi:hypothetical protein
MEWIKNKKESIKIFLYLSLLLLGILIIYKFLHRVGFALLVDLIILVTIPALVSLLFCFHYPDHLVKKWKRYSLYWLIPTSCCAFLLSVGKKSELDGILYYPIFIVLVLYILSTPFYLHHQAKKMAKGTN